MFSRNGSLLRRLTITFIVIVIVPLAIAGYVVQAFVVNKAQQDARDSLSPALDTAVQRYNDRVGALPQLIQASIANPRLPRLIRVGDDKRIDEVLASSLRDATGIDYLVVTDDSGSTLGSASSNPSFAPGVSDPKIDDLTKVGAHKGFVSVGVPLRVLGGPRLGTVIGGFWLDDSFLAPNLGGRVSLSVTSDGQVISSTQALDKPTKVNVQPGFFPTTIGKEGTGRARPLSGGMALIASTSSGPLEETSSGLLNSLLVVLGLALVGTVAFAYLLARLITRPLEELSEGARAITEGRFDHRIQVRSRDEIGQLATAFNEMTERLDGTISALQASRDQLRQTVLRVGETLRSTHDMRQMLEQVLYTAGDAVASDAAVMWMVSPTRDQMLPLASRGARIETLAPVDTKGGIAGSVVGSARPLVLPSKSKEHANLGPAPGEPRFPNVIAAPLISRERVMAVLTLYRRSSEKPFSQQDFETVSFLAEQGGVAIENVLLHEEAQRLSLTDGLTGLWNRRYFEMQFRQVLATAIRFERPFSILMLDLDRFKNVNDTYGHQIGDGALVEFAHRVRDLIREVDTFARYGGEEFICLLSETDLEGAMFTANKIHQEVRESAMDIDGQLVSMTVSIGVASYPDHGNTFTSLVDAADRALYRAKQEGRDRVSLPGPSTSGRLHSAT